MAVVSFGRVGFEGSSMRSVVIPAVSLRVMIVGVKEDSSSVEFILSPSRKLASGDVRFKVGARWVTWGVIAAGLFGGQFGQVWWCRLRISEGRKPVEFL